MAMQENCMPIDSSRVNKSIERHAKSMSAVVANDGRYASQCHQHRLAGRELPIDVVELLAAGG
ncbi:MAG: hypothetical protein M3O41_19060, partial [Pseudomonadota bacterium]|nr:hypothetical protein [Pseudomonadota bacterium]